MNQNHPVKIGFTASAIAHPNIAFIKYWGNRDSALRLPANGSISMNLADLVTETSVTFSPLLKQDVLLLNAHPASPEATQRVSQFLNRVRQLAGTNLFASVTSYNNFPTGAGIASSASAFAALALAASTALNLNLNQAQLSRLARRGSGSACRSIPSGFVEWVVGDSDENSWAQSFAPPEHWPLVDLIAIVHRAHKQTGSSEGHHLASTSPLQEARLRLSTQHLDQCRQAILACDFSAFSQVVELDSTLMHAVMMTSTPPLFYWEPASLRLLKLIPAWRAEGIPVCATVDAGPNIHVITLEQHRSVIQTRLEALSCVTQVITSSVGGPAQIKST